MTAGRWALLAAMVLTGCTSAPVTAPSAETVAMREVRLPPTSGPFDYQLGGAADVGGLTTVVRDASARPLPGAYNVCYVNGFQTQPGQGEEWLTHHGAAVLRDADGSPVRDPDWPDEYVLDPSTAERRAAILDVLAPVLSGCAREGFDAVEIDNLDTFTRFTEPATGRVDEAGALELARSYADLAHRNGVAIGQKNAADAVEAGRHDVGFDFAVTEECAAYDECGDYRRGYGSHVLQIEYVDNLPRPFAEVCASPDRAPLTILRDRRLVPPGTPGYARAQC